MCAAQSGRISWFIYKHIKLLSLHSHAAHNPHRPKALGTLRFYSKIPSSVLISWMLPYSLNNNNGKILFYDILKDLAVTMELWAIYFYYLKAHLRGLMIISLMLLSPRRRMKEVIHIDDFLSMFKTIFTFLLTHFFSLIFDRDLNISEVNK